MTDFRLALATEINTRCESCLPFWNRPPGLTVDQIGTTHDFDVAEPWRMRPVLRGML